MKNKASVQKDDDPLWYKDAIIYQVHVKSFYDSNNDGVGDFKGLIEKLDYIASLGVNAIWLLPFYPSPRRDDGYDISNYRDIHPEYGSLKDVRRFIDQAHARGIRIITELVINHTSDQHPWFQRARIAKPGSVARDYYVWSNSDEKYAGTRIIFVDSEKSNWTWDDTAKAFYWHRFFSHQPDLNFDNPRVVNDIFQVMRFWLDMGVDGLRLDAVPYLIERDGTNNENLAETHNILKMIRRELDAYAPGKMLLAEANQWPEDAQQYFGEGDECHMSFHFPLMPRMYMAIAQEDRFPITDILRQTPAIPDNCQWAIFLRNHDELTLEMVTDSERDYLWETYAADRRARINLGIRRRLAPLMEHDRRRIELMNGLLLSMPGTPVIYYGDEIGMGDNIHLGDRDGVRTPMQWSPDRNGGFSRANPADLVLPPVMDAIYGYDAVNVEAQSGDLHSLLNWTRRMLAVRKRHQAFGRGSQQFLYPGNRKVLAFLRLLPSVDAETETILCVYNLSRTAQAVELDLSNFSGRVPFDLLGGAAFPPIGALSYLLTLQPYGFYWFILATEAALPAWHVRPSEPLPELVTLVVRGGLADVLLPAQRQHLENDALPAYLQRRRWFASKDKVVKTVKLSRADQVISAPMDALFAEIEVQLADKVEHYNLPLAISWDGETNAALPQQLALARIRLTRKTGYLTDAFAVDGFSLGLIEAVRNSKVIKLEDSEIRFIPTKKLEGIKLSDSAEILRLSAEQSNSSLIVEKQIVVKIIRKAVDGVNPEIEMVGYLTEQGYQNTPALLGEIMRVEAGGTKRGIVVLQAFVHNQGDAWQYTLNYLSRYIEASVNEHGTDGEDTQPLAVYAVLARAMGTRLAQLHEVLARDSDDIWFKPETANKLDAEKLIENVKKQLNAAYEMLEAKTDFLDEETSSLAAYILQRKQSILALLPQFKNKIAGYLRTRIHGDLHLGQILVATNDAYIIDFEGEPSKSMEVRRSKDSPLRDVAGLLGSFHYACAASTMSYRAAPTSSPEHVSRALQRFMEDAQGQFLNAYHAVEESCSVRWAENKSVTSALLDLFMLEKSAYEICYEIANRPSWLLIPLRVFAGAMKRLQHDEMEAENAR